MFMIEIEFAKRFIQRVTQFTDYNINVMDKDGIIIASCEFPYKSRVMAT